MNTRGIFLITEKAVLPKSQNEDSARREFILNILLVASIAIILSAFFIQIVVRTLDLLPQETYEQSGLPLLITFRVLSFLVLLYILSRKGFFVPASYLLLGTLFLLSSYMVFKWGVDLPAAALFYVLVIVMAGILISSRFAFFVTAAIAFSLILFGYLERRDIVVSNQYWKSELWTPADIIMTILIFGIVATVSWLSNREIGKSLARARKSEAELKMERDSLEVKVEERTRELKETQAEKMTQLYRFAEFGRLSSGLFHDLINPLNAVSLNMEKIKGGIGNGENIFEVGTYVDQAIGAARKMEDFVVAVRKQLTRQEYKSLFSLNKEIDHVINVLAHKARKADVEVRFSNPDEVKIFGNAVKFNQVVLNLIANAMDAYAPSKNGVVGSRIVRVSLNKEKNEAVLSVKDAGVGIPEGNMPKIFEPFFTTKPEGRGMGIGLSMIKRIVEKDFGGAISAESVVGEGSIFTARFPRKT